MKRNGLARWGRWIVLGLLVSLTGASVSSGEDLVLYDNFDGLAHISPDKWFGSETRRPNAILEASRFVTDGKLRLIAAGYGGTGSNHGRQTGHFGLGVKTSRPITALQAEVTITNRMAQSCPENPLSTQSRAQLLGFFFNDGTRHHPEDLTGDIVAVLEKVADSKDGHFTRAVVLRCTSRSCGTGDTIKALLFKRSWLLNQPDVLRIEWDPPKSQFIFSLNPGTEAEETRHIGYGKVTHPSEPPKFQRQRIRVRNHGANCTSGRRGVLMNVSVDDVYLRFLDPKATFGFESKVPVSVLPSNRATPQPPPVKITAGSTER